MADRYRFELLVPTRWQDGWAFARSCCQPDKYLAYLKQAQVLRGTAYLEDGAIRPCDLDKDGRLQMTGDEEGWHLLLVENDSDSVIGCVRYLLHANDVSFQDLNISRCAAGTDLVTGPMIRSIVEADLDIARRTGLGYVEVGGLVIMSRWRRTTAALHILAASYALGQLWGGCLGICTATFRNGSASMIRRFSGSTSSSAFGPFTVYYDVRYNCLMELLRFKSEPAERYAGFVTDAKTELLQVQALRRDSTPLTLPLVA